MPADEPFSFTDTATISVGGVGAPTCPVEARTTWTQLIVAFASVALFAALFIGAVTRDPGSLPGAVLSAVALVVTTWVFLGSVKSRFDSRRSGRAGLNAGPGFQAPGSETGS